MRVNRPHQICPSSRGTGVERQESRSDGAHLNRAPGRLAPLGSQISRYVNQCVLEPVGAFLTLNTEP